MKHSIALLAILACFGAHAGGSHSTTPVVGGAGSYNNNPGGNAAQQQAQSTQIGIKSIVASMTKASGGKATATGGALTNSGNGKAEVFGSGNLSLGAGTLSPAGGSLDMAGARIGSDVITERSAPSIFGATPTQPTQPCARPGISIGGSSTSGGGLLSIPTGTDVTCRVDNALTIMARNPKLFSDDDRLTVTCKQEDIAETQACKDLAARKANAARASAILEDRAAPIAQQRMPYQAGG